MSSAVLKALTVIEEQAQRIAELEAGYKKRATECERLWNNNERLRAVYEAAKAIEPWILDYEPCEAEATRAWENYLEALAAVKDEIEPWDTCKVEDET